MGFTKLWTFSIVGFVGLWHFTTSPAQAANPLASYNVVYGWKVLDYKFPSEQTKARYLSNGEFIPENNVITGVKVKDKRIYMTVPRWRQGVPASLVYVDFEPDETTGAIGEIRGPLLNPFPSWEMNILGDCNAFQYIQSMEIDQFGRMWVVDVGRVHIFSNRTAQDDKCPPKLILLDLATGTILHKYEFPKDVVSPTSNFLNDIAVACVSPPDCYAYITDALSDAKIIVYNYGENRSWFVHHSSMLANQDAVNITILGGDYQFNVNVDGIAVSPKDSNFNRLFYCPLSSVHLFSVPTSVLQTAVNGDNLPDTVVKNEGLKSSQSDGLAMDANGLLFVGLLDSNGVAYYNTSSHEKVTEKKVLLVQNDVDLQWPDTFGFDESGYLYVATNRLQRFKGNKYDPGETNFRIVRIYTGAKSYMYSATASKKISESETIPPSVYEATPRTNLDTKVELDDKIKYDHPDAKQQAGKGSIEMKPADTTSNDDDHGKTNSSVALDSTTKCILLLVLVTFTVYPAV